MEMALTVPLVILLVLGTVDFGRAVYIHNALANAARDAARFASVDPTNTICIRTLAARNSSIARVEPGDVAVSLPGSVEVGQPVTVVVQSTYQPLSTLIAGAIGVNSLTMQGRATMSIRNVPASPVGCP